VERSVGGRARGEPEPSIRFTEERLDVRIDGLETFECCGDVVMSTVDLCGQGVVSHRPIVLPSLSLK
jgi:hypothetical protein